MGGMGTNAYVSNWYSLTNGEMSVIGGLILELCETLCKERQAAPCAIEAYKNGKLLGTVGFNQEGLKSLFDRLCQQAGVEIHYFTRVIDADVDKQKGRVNDLVTNKVEGYRYIAAKTFIDATGDVILSDLCGDKAYAAGKDKPNIMPPALCAMISCMDYEQYKSST